MPTPEKGGIQVHVQGIPGPDSGSQLRGILPLHALLQEKVMKKGKIVDEILPVYTTENRLRRSFMKIKIGQRFLSILLTALMVLTIVPMSMIQSYAAENKSLNVNWNIIHSIGTQFNGNRYSGMCSAYALAYCRAMLDREGM